MSTILNQVLFVNHDYSKGFDKTDLSLPPGREFAILTGMGARLDLTKYAGFAEGNAHVIRIADGSASNDAIRSLVISYKLFGTREWYVINHTDCGMESFTNEIISEPEPLDSRLKTASVDAAGCQGPNFAENRYINWLTIKDQALSVTEDVIRIKSHPVVPADIPVYGCIYDVKTCSLIEVPSATEAGKAK